MNSAHLGSWTEYGADADLEDQAEWLVLSSCVGLGVKSVVGCMTECISGHMSTSVQACTSLCNVENTRGSSSHILTHTGKNKQAWSRKDTSLKL